jgi:hypothetical protein
MTKLDEFEKKVKKMSNGLKHWILVNDKLKEVDLMTWAKWFEDKTNPGRITAQTKVKGIFISTVFMGLDHSFGGKVPILWETMIFNAKHKALKDYQVRYSSLKDAKAGHEYAVKFTEYILGIRKTEHKESANML